MNAYIDETLRFSSETDNSFAALLMSIITLYREHEEYGDEILITFSEDEENEIKNQARKLLKDSCSEPEVKDETSELTLLKNALQAMISTIELSSLETLKLCFYIKSVAGNKERKTIGIVFHSFSPYHRIEKQVTSFTIFPIETKSEVDVQQGGIGSATIG